MKQKKKLQKSVKGHPVKKTVKAMAFIPYEGTKKWAPDEIIPER